MAVDEVQGLTDNAKKLPKDYYHIFRKNTQSIFMRPETRKWIEAGRIPQSDPSAVVLCPECGKGHLIVDDVVIEGDKIDRYLLCDNCGKWNVITMIKPENQK